MSWPQVQLGDVIRLKRGHDLPASGRVPGEIPIVSSSGVTGYHNVAKVAGPGVVTGRYGTLGEVHYIESDYWPLNTALYVEDFKGNHPRYVSYLLMTLELGTQNAAGAVPGVNRNTLHQIVVRVPDPETQRRIATALSTYDDLIATNQRRIGLLEEAARLLYREWFVHLRFSGYESVPVRDGVPEGWKNQSLSSVADVNARTIGSKDRPESILYIDISSVTPGLIGDVTSYSFADAPGRARRCVAHGDVIWSCVRPNRRSYALIWEPDENLVVSTGFAVLSAGRIPFSYLYFVVTTDDFVEYLEQHATGAAYPAVTAKIFEDSEIVVPDADTLASFDNTVLPMLEQLEVLKLQNASLAKARDLLLPKLMSGQLDASRISLPEEVTRYALANLTLLTKTKANSATSGQ